MKAITIHDAKTNLSKYLEAAKRGQKIFIGPRGEPEFEIVYRKTAAKKVYRKLGVAKGKIWIAQDAFSEETDAEIAAQIYGDDE